MPSDGGGGSYGGDGDHGGTGSGGGGYGDGGNNGGSDWGGINAEIGQTMSEAASVKSDSQTSSFLKGFFSSFSPSILGIASGLYKGFSSLTDANKQAAISAVKAANPGISDSMAEALARGYAESMASGVASGEISASGGGDGVDSWIQDNITTTNGLAIPKVKTNFGDGGNVGTYSYNSGSSQIWEDYVNSHYDKALGEYQNQASKINTATEKQSGLLDSLISGLSEGNNLKPVTRDVGSQTYSWIPKANRETTEQIKSYGQQGLLNSVTDALTGNANLNYLASLKDLAKDETTKSAADKGVSIQQQQVDQNEPGFLDYAKGVASLLGGASSLSELFS